MAASGGASLRLILAACFLSLSAQEVSRTKSSSGSTYVLDIPTDFHERVKAFDDFVELIELPTCVASEFDVSVSYRSRGLRLITLEVITIGIRGQETVEYSTHEYIFEQTKEKKTVTFHVHLRDSLVFCENRALGLFPDLHVERVFVDVTLTALGVPVRAGDPDSVYKNDQRFLALIPPLSRPQKPGFSFSWIWHMLAYGEGKIRTCNALNDGMSSEVGSLAWPVFCSSYYWGVPLLHALTNINPDLTQTNQPTVLARESFCRNRQSSPAQVEFVGCTVGTERRSSHPSTGNPLLWLPLV